MVDFRQLKKEMGNDPLATEIFEQNKETVSKDAEDYLYQQKRDLLLSMKLNPFKALAVLFNRYPQPVRDEFRDEYERLLSTTWDDWEEAKMKIKAEWFDTFNKDLHITWQQNLIFWSYTKAMRNEATRKLAISSGHGTGKSSSIAMLILIFLLTHYNSQIRATAPTSNQLNDVLWKELQIWLSTMPEAYRMKYIWSKEYIRMAYSPDTWFASAKTASKENPEALAGVHAPDVMLVVDEASGVAEQIYKTAAGALTNENTFLVVISNPTRVTGYFYNAFHKNRAMFQNLYLNSEESPIVRKTFRDEIINSYGIESDEFRIRVLGRFPDSEIADDSGFVPLIYENKIIKSLTPVFIGRVILGVDPAGEGQNKTVWVARDNFKARRIAQEDISNPKSIAEKTLTLAFELGIQDGEQIVIENFGVGADVAKEIAIATKGKMEVTTVAPQYTFDRENEYEDWERYLNLRAKLTMKGRDWLISGGMIYDPTGDIVKDALNIRFKRNLSGKIQIMDKVRMRKVYGAQSPDNWDAFAMTFAVDFEELPPQKDPTTLADDDFEFADDGSVYIN